MNNYITLVLLIFAAGLLSVASAGLEVVERLSSKRGARAAIVKFEGKLYFIRENSREAIYISPERYSLIHDIMKKLRAVKKNLSRITPPSESQSSPRYPSDSKKLETLTSSNSKTYKSNTDYNIDSSTSSNTHNSHNKSDNDKNDKYSQSYNKNDNDKNSHSHSHSHSTNRNDYSNSNSYNNKSDKKEEENPTNDKTLSHSNSANRNDNENDNSNSHSNESHKKEKENPTTAETPIDSNSANKNDNDNDSNKNDNDNSNKSDKKEEENPTNDKTPPSSLASNTKFDGSNTSYIQGYDKLGNERINSTTTSNSNSFCVSPSLIHPLYSGMAIVAAFILV
jgi:hypothetical protein